MKLTKMIAAFAAATFVFAGTLAAQEDWQSFGDDVLTSDSSSDGAFSDFSSDFSDDFSSDFSFGDDSFSSSSSSGSPFTLNAKGEVAARYYVDDRNGFSKTSVEAIPSADVTIGYQGARAEIEMKFAINEDVIKNFQRGIIDELTMRAFLGNFVLEAGNMKVVWGKGDKLHVLDMFNANDYTDFLVPDYIDRRIAEPMVRVAWNCPTDFFLHSFRIEGVYTPFMLADRLGTGRWQPAQAGTLANSVTSIAGREVATKLAAVHAIHFAGTTPTPAEQQQLAAATAAYTLALSKSQSIADDLYPNLYQLKYGQAGLRLTGTVGIVDLGLSYYYGHYKQPSVDAKKMRNFVARYLLGWADSDDTFLAYDTLNMFGIEAGSAVGPLTLRSEFAYYLTNDTAGDDPAVRNNSLNWLFGFDWNLPVNNLNINIQTTGQYILRNGKIDSNKLGTEHIDTEYDADGLYSNNKIVFNISDSYRNEKIKPECTIIYGIEHGDFIVQPKLTINIFGGFDMIAKGMYITHFYDKNRSEFSAFQQNSFVQIGVSYSF